MTSNFDDNEKLDILFKKSLNISNTRFGMSWFDEDKVPFNNYINSEYVLLENVPENPDFDINGIVRTAESIDLCGNTDFYNYTFDTNNKENCSIVDDSTGKIRRYKYLILDQVPGVNNGDSWYKTDSSDNIITYNILQFNYKNNGAFNPYNYTLFSQKSFLMRSKKIPQGITGGNWFIDIHNGLLLFPDFENLQIYLNSNYWINNTDNKPVLTFYTYIGRKGLDNLILPSSNTFNVLQIASTNIISKETDLIIDSSNYTIINDLSVNLNVLKLNSKYKILLNFNYASPSYFDTFFKIGLFYKIYSGTDISENLISEYKLGSEYANSSFDQFSKNFYTDISSQIGDILNFYIKAKIYRENNNVEDIPNNDDFKPKIIFTTLGNILNVEEVNLAVS
tara:strand:- start:156 stop:1337 length:1182 start_codon:yes stop_codon:yes gene_type:complete